MAVSISTFQPYKVLFISHLHKRSSLLLPSSISLPNPTTTLTTFFPLLRATSSHAAPLNETSSKKKKKKRRTKTDEEDSAAAASGNYNNNNNNNNIVQDVEIIKSEVDFVDGNNYKTKRDSNSNSFHPTMPLPKPPAGFVIDASGRVLMASNKRVATVVDSSNNYPLECIIRRVFRSSQGDDCMLLCPVDTPVQILKSTNVDGWSAVSDEEVETILPAAAYALAKIHMHLVHSGFCYTARGGFCYSDDDIFDFRTDDGQDVEGLPTEGVEITCFHMDGAHYMIYTPSDPYLFVAVKDQNGQLQIADDDLLEDAAVISAIDEETEFNALVEEEAALLESLMGER